MNAEQKWTYILRTLQSMVNITLLSWGYQELIYCMPFLTWNKTSSNINLLSDFLCYFSIHYGTALIQFIILCLYWKLLSDLLHLVSVLFPPVGHKANNIAVYGKQWYILIGINKAVQLYCISQRDSPERCKSHVHHTYCLFTMQSESIWHQYGLLDLIFWNWLDIQCTMYKVRSVDGWRDEGYTRIIKITGIWVESILCGSQKLNCPTYICRKEL